MGTRQLGLREAPLDLAQDVEDVLAGAERVLPEVGTGAERIAPLEPAKSDAVALAALTAGHLVVRPGVVGVARPHPHPLDPGPHATIFELAREQLRVTERLGRHPLSGWRRQPQRELLRQHQCERRTDVLAWTRACGTAPGQPPARGVGEAQGGDGVGEVQAKRAPRELRLCDVDVEATALGQQHLAPRAEQLDSRNEGEVGEQVAERRRRRGPDCPPCRSHASSRSHGCSALLRGRALLVLHRCSSGLDSTRRWLRTHETASVHIAEPADKPEISTRATRGSPQRGGGAPTTLVDAADGRSHSWRPSPHFEMLRSCTRRTGRRWQRAWPRRRPPRCRSRATWRQST